MATESGPGSEQMARLAERFFAAIERSDRAELEAIYSADAVVWHNFDNREQSREDNIANLMRFPEMFQSIRYADIRRSYFQGGFVQQHVCRGVKADGQSFDVPVCMVVKVVDGCIARIDEYFDSSQDARPKHLR